MMAVEPDRRRAPPLVVCPRWTEEREGYTMMSEAFKFYKDRLSACPSYGFVSGHEILKTVTRCAFWDSTLTGEEFNSIINLAELAHIKMMEDNYNAGWKDK